MTFSITAAVAPRGSALVLVDQIVVQRLEVAESTETASVELAPLAIGRHTVQVVFIGAEGFAHSSSDLLNLKVTGSAPVRHLTRLGWVDVTDAPASAWGFGLATLDSAGNVLDVWFPQPALGSPGSSEAPAELDALATPDDVRGVTREVRLVEIADLSSAPASTEDAWLRLHLLSHRLVHRTAIRSTASSGC